MTNTTVSLAGRPVQRIGFGAMQLPGPGVFGPPRDRGQAIAVLRAAIAAGVNHIDTAQYYGPDVSNELIHAALHPYPDDLTLVSKVGAVRSVDGSWRPAQRPEELRAGVEDNLRSLQLTQVPVVNLRRSPGTDVGFDEQLDAMQAMRDEGLIGGIGLSNVGLDSYLAARSRVSVACVQNAYNFRERSEQALFDRCRDDAVPFVPFFPLGSALPRDDRLLDTPAVRDTATRLAVTPAQVALAWLLAQAPTVLLIPGTSSLAHLAENLAVDEVVLDDEAREVLDRAVG